MKGNGENMSRGKNLKTRFIEECYDGNKEAYLRAREQDYCKVQFEWTCWMDALHKEGQITDQQWNSAIF